MILPENFTDAAAALIAQDARADLLALADEIAAFCAAEYVPTKTAEEARYLQVVVDKLRRIQAIIEEN